MNCSTPGFPVLHQLPELAQTHVHWVGDAIQSSHCLSSPSSARNLSQHQGLFQWVSSSHQVAKVLELLGLIYFRIDWFDLLVVQGTLKSLLQHHSSKASILGHSGFFRVQLSQFKSVNSWTLRFLYSPTLTSIHRFLESFWSYQASQIMWHPYMQIIH